eukprot:TRINITY_DN3099_c0_g2_i3.p1 TRINITY_DN3099_c0_g2~~TRINITY_DN3099_c0_g2_i3.p1  ORF type:complete len:425 (-),score=79.33 TRINITY_DN3099_c0_g2_i3:424-1698(-)
MRFVFATALLPWSSANTVFAPLKQTSTPALPACTPLRTTTRCVRGRAPACTSAFHAWMLRRLANAISGTSTTFVFAMWHEGPESSAKSVLLPLKLTSTPLSPACTPLLSRTRSPRPRWPARTSAFHSLMLIVHTPTSAAAVGDGGGGGGGPVRPGDGGSGGEEGSGPPRLSPLNDEMRMMIEEGDDREGAPGDKMGEFDSRPLIGDVAGPPRPSDSPMVRPEFMELSQCEDGVVCRVHDVIQCVRSMQECEARRCALSSDICRDAGSMVEVLVFLPERMEQEAAGMGMPSAMRAPVVATVQSVSRVPIRVSIPPESASGKLLSVTSVRPESDEMGFGVLEGNAADIRPLASDVLEIELLDVVTGEPTKEFDEAVTLEFTVSSDLVWQPVLAPPAAASSLLLSPLSAPSSSATARRLAGPPSFVN